MIHQFQPGIGKNFHSGIVKPAALDAPSAVNQQNAATALPKLCKMAKLISAEINDGGNGISEVVHRRTS